jgi:hypothetical protein
MGRAGIKITRSSADMRGRDWKAEALEGLRVPAVFVYSTVENLLQTAFYAKTFGRAPDCALLCRLDR